MSLTLYNDALLSKFEGIYDNVVYSTTEEAFRKSALKMQKSNVTLPLISFYRTGFNITANLRNDPEFRSGRSSLLQSEDSTVRKLRSVPVTIQYQLDLWAQSQVVLDQMIQEVIFWLVGNPIVKVEVPSVGYQVDFSIMLEDDIVDNTDIQSFEEGGRIYRKTLSLMTQSARLFSFHDIKTVLHSVQTEIEIE